MHRHGNHQSHHNPCSSFVQQGKFGRLFPTLPAHEPDPEALEALGLKGGPMDEGEGGGTPDSSTIPAGFTFLAQFIDHDITLDPTSSLDRHNDPATIRNFRTPLLELDCVYGAGPGANPHLYDQTDPSKLLIGTSENPNDLPRNKQGTALIGDPRNDENLIISQLQLAFLKFHNAVVDYLREQGTESKKVFSEAQRLVRWHYQWVVVHEILPLIIGQYLVDDILRDGPRYYRPKATPFIPVEFSVAAYRFGHSQVRSRYKINEGMTSKLFDLPFFAPIQPDQVIDWSNFFHISSGKTPQFSRRIDAKIAETLLDLQPPIVSPGTPAARRSLAVRNLQRGTSFGLPTGQTVAKAMGIKPLTDEELGLTSLGLLGQSFKGEAPLWFYILKEADVQTKGETLGRVGGRIVGEVLLGLLKADALSYFNLEPHWRPEPAIAPTGQFVDLLKFAGVVSTDSPTVSREATPVPTAESDYIDLVTFASSTEQVLSPVVVDEPTSAATTPKRLAGQPRLRELEVLAIDSDTSPNLLQRDQPFDLRLTLDLTSVYLPHNTALSYSATAYAKCLDDGSHQIIGEAYDQITPTDTFVITIASKGLPAGLYRLETAVALNVLPDDPDVTATMEGSLLQVY